MPLGAARLRNSFARLHTPCTRTYVRQTSKSVAVPEVEFEDVSGRYLLRLQPKQKKGGLEDKPRRTHTRSRTHSHRILFHPFLQKPRSSDKAVVTCINSSWGKDTISWIRYQPLNIIDWWEVRLRIYFSQTYLSRHRKKSTGQRTKQPKRVQKRVSNSAEFY